LPRVLFAWELGRGYGHLAHLLPTMRAFAAAGWEVVSAARRSEALQAEGYATLQAPQAPRVAPSSPALNLSSVLLDCGYRSAATLGPLFEAWRRLLDEARADLVCAEYAPTALLAARIARLPSIVFGMGFFLPPLVAPLPSMQPWREIPEAELARLEARALAAVNGLCDPPLSRFADIWDADARFLCTWPELDHYGPRAGVDYSGPLTPSRPFPLPSGASRAFVYLWAEDPRLPSLLESFSATGVEVFGHLRGAQPAQLEALSAPGRRLSSQPLDALEALEAAHFVVTNGGHGLVSEALRAGRPLLLLPTQAEQAALSVRLARQGLAFTVDPRRPSPDFAIPLRKLAAGACAEAAQAFSRRHAGHDPAALAARIAAAASRLVSVARYV
jgi:hypothetical protein